jgi:hypothetical protein
MAIPLIVLMPIAALIFSAIYYFRWKSSLAVAGGNDVPLKIGLLALLATAAGVVASYFVVQRHFDLTTPNIIGAGVATVFANLGSFLLLKEKKEFSYLDFISFVKDGFLWSSTYPALAAAFHQIQFPIKG